MQRRSSRVAKKRRRSSSDEEENEITESQSEEDSASSASYTEEEDVPENSSSSSAEASQSDSEVSLCSNRSQRVAGTLSACPTWRLVFPHQSHTQYFAFADALKLHMARRQATPGPSAANKPICEPPVMTNTTREFTHAKPVSNHAV